MWVENNKIKHDKVLSSTLNNVSTFMKGALDMCWHHLLLLLLRSQHFTLHSFSIYTNSRLPISYFLMSYHFTKLTFFFSLKLDYLTNMLQIV